MKKYLFSLFVAVFATAMGTYARTVLIDEGFENGISEEVWTQEFVLGNTPWMVESDHLSWPSTTVQGVSRAYLRNTTGETEGYATRLISKVMDLRPTKVYMPELIFYYANPKWGADRDTLRVLYRTDERLSWKTLAEYSTASSDWQRVKISLPEAGKTYQIAFEGKDNLGRGIVLDSIKVQSAPECTVPYDLMATNKGAGKVNIAWMASFDADYYEVVVTQDTIDPDMIDEIEMDTPEKIVYHGQITDETNKDLILEAGELYLLYVRSICGDEISSWSSELTEGMPFGFKVRTIKNVPFTENFNYPAGTIRDVDWVWAGNTQNTNPFVNSRASATAWAYYSPDVTSSVIFSGGETSKPEQAIPADRYVYLATPALADTLNDGFQINQCQVHFWSTVYTYTGRQYGRSIIVGVMDDPDDITTFTPVDTVEVWGNKTFQENIVDLGSYDGTGAYVAFVSRFDRQNLFYLDNLTIEYRKNVNKVTKITVNPRDTYADISWEGNASSYNVLITNTEVDPTHPASSAIVDQATVTANSYRCTRLEADHSWNRPYYVYVLAAGTEWSYRYPFVTLAPQRAIPYNFDFETSTTTKYTIPGMSGSFVTGLGVFGNNGTTYPAVLTDSKYSYGGLGSLFMSKRGGADTWITLPMVEDLSNVQVKFYLSGSNTFNQAHATIGIMSNPMDINTFVPVSHFTLNTEGYTRCYANFTSYTGPDGVIAIVWDDVMKMSQNTINYIDEITVEELSDCVPPTNIELQIEPDSITMRWEETSWDLWEVFLSRTALKETDRLHKTFEEIQALRGVVLADSLEWNNPNAKPQFGFGDLTPHATYYLYVRATCDPDWWTEMSFATPCREETFPFKDSFEEYNIESTLAGCWQLADYMGVGYPRIANAGTAGYPEKVLDLYSSGTIHRSVAILPAIDGNLSDMLLAFDVRTEEGGTSSTAVVYVGSMEDIEDQSSFVPFDTVYVSGGAAFKKVRFILSDYELAHENIAITTGLGSNLEMSSHVFIDNVELKDPSCIDAYDFKQSNFAPHSIDIAWQGLSDTDQWELKVLSSNANLNAVKNNSYNSSWDVVRDTVITGKTFHLEGLQALHTYYVYVRSLCGDSAWVATTAETSCELLDPTKANKETFDTHASGTGQVPTCWYSANSDPNATSTYIPYIYNSTTYSNSGSNTFRLYGSSSSYGVAYVVSPEINCDTLSHIAVTFYMYASTSYRWVLGVMTDPTDLSTFVTIDSVQGVANSIQYTYDLSEYASVIPASAKYVAWRTPYNATSYAYLDDVSFVSVACPLTKPSISELTTTSVRVSSGLRTNDQWILMITNAPISDADLARENYVVPASQLVYLDTISRRSQSVNVLEAQTKYYVYTAALCDAATMSQWNSLSFTTPCSSITPEEMGTITFSDKEGFTIGSSGERPCWTVGNKTQTASSSYIPYVNNSSTYKHNDNNYLYFYDYVSSSSSTVGAYAIMPELEVDSIKKYQVTFWGRGYSTSSYNSQIIVGVITDPSDLNTFVAIDTLNLSHTAWDPYSVGFENYEGDYMGDLGRNIMFLSDFGKTNYAYISEISVELIPRCRPIQSFTVDSVGEDRAVISWKGYQDTYRVLLSDKLLTEDQKPKYNYLLDTIVNHSDEVLITDLNPTTQYYVYAQGICEGGDSTAISITYASFKTPCPTSGGVPLPLFEDFESYSANTRDIGCWLLRGGTTYPQVVSAQSNGSKAVDLYSPSYASWLVLPAVDADLYDTKLSFDICPYSSTSTGRLYVGTIADPEDLSTFVPIDTFNTTQFAFVHHEMILADYELMYDRIAFTSGVYQGTTIDIDIDNIGLEYVSNCNAPKLKFIGSSLESAELRLTPYKQDDAQWQVVVLTESQYNNAGDITRYLNAAPKMTLDSTHIVLTGLASASSYYVFARTVCDEGAVSSWMRSPVKFSTKFYFADSYAFGFEKSELWQRSPNSESDNYYLHPALVAGRDTIGAETQSYMYYPHSRTNDTTYHYSLQGVGATNGALMMHARGEYFGGYIIFPAIDNAQARSFEFKVRPDYLDFGSKLPVAQTNAILEVGTIEKDKDFDTYQHLATIRLDALDGNVIGGYTSKKKYGYSYFTLDLDETTVATKQVVLHMPKQPSDSTYICVDSVALGAPKGVSLVSLKKVTADGTSALVEWDNIGGPWNLVITNVATGVAVASFTNLNGVTSQLVENLDPQTDYIATLSGAAWPSAAKNFANASANATKLAFRTLCLPMEPNMNGTDFVWNFDNSSDWEANDVLGGGASDSLYFKPGCFHVGLTYDAPANGYQWLIQRKGYETSGPLTTYNASRHLEVGRNDSHALRIHTTEANFNSYIVLPELNCRFDTMMLEFYGRCFANYDQTHNLSTNRNKIADATYLNDAYSHSIVVGTLTDPSDFSSLQILDTLTYMQTDLKAGDNVANDPAGLRYWELKQMPLEFAQGKFIVLFQPAPGLFYIDDLAVKPVGNTLFPPTNTRTTGITSTSATLAWNTHHPEYTTVIVLLDATGEEINRIQTTGTSYQLTGLTPAMNYQWYVFQTNGTSTSASTKPINFNTDCVVLTPDYTCSFEPAEGWMNIEGQKNYTQTLCWTYGDAAQDGAAWVNANYDPYNQENNRNYSYSYNGSTALMMHATTSSRLTYQPYVAMPAMDVTAYDTLQVMFWMRPAYISAANDSVAMSYTGSTYSKSVIVGTMTDPANVSTFVPIDTVTYDGTLSVEDQATPENDFLFQQMKVELTGATGPYIAFMTSFFEKGSKAQKTGDYIWIDDISFAHRQECKDPIDLKELQIGTEHAVLTWNAIDSAGTYRVQVSTDPFFAKEEAFVFNDVVESNTCTVKGLQPLSTYVWRVQALCGDRWGESSFSQKATFKTNRSPYFLEEFTTTVSANEWTFSKAHADNVLDSTGVVARGVDNWSFSRKTDNNGLQGPHYAAIGYNTDYHWMITPAFYLPEDDSVHLSMDLALTACNTAHLATSNAITDNDVKDDYYVMIIVSEDGGATWKSRNILAKWQNTNQPGMQLRDISSTGMRVRYSLASYAGKNVRIGLYREARTTSNTGMVVHVDNVRLGYFDKTIEPASACQYEDVTIGGITLDGEVTKPGIHSYPTCFYATDAEARAGKRDSVQQLEIEVFPAQETFFTDTICEGEQFTGYDFLPKTATGIYHRKLLSHEHGCDSVVTLDLYVKPRKYALDEEVSICAGDNYIWNDKAYNRAGIYRDTLLSSIGCDSIMTLIVSYLADETDTLYAESMVDLEELPFTYNDPLHPYLAGQTITYPAGTPQGVYMDTVRVQGDACTTILIHTLTVYDKHQAIDNVFDGKKGARKLIYRDNLYIILNDEWYNASGQKVSDPRR